MIAFIVRDGADVVLASVGLVDAVLRITSEKHLDLTAAPCPGSVPNPRARLYNIVRFANIISCPISDCFIRVRVRVCACVCECVVPLAVLVSVVGSECCCVSRACVRVE